MMRRIFVLFFAAATGYVSLSQEMLWMRAVSYMTGGEPSVFAHVLGFFLIGVALGALLGEKLCEKRFAGAESWAAPFVGGMLGISAMFYYLSIALTAELLTVSQRLGTGVMYLVVMVASFLLGGVFPVLCHYGAKAEQPVGPAISRLYLANIVGSTLGPLLTGFVLMQYLDADRIILCLSVGTLLLGGIAWLFDRRRGARWALVGAAGVAAVMLALHGSLYGGLLEKLHFQTRYYGALRYKHVIQNRSGIIAVTEDASGQADMLYGGGVYDGTFNIDPVMNSNSIRRAYMIAGLHRNPQEVLEIGLASGSWSRVVAGYEPVQKHSIVEINPGYLALMDRYRPQRDLLSDRKVTIHIDDGRRWLNRNPEAKFDLIVQNTTWHWRSQITNLLSEEYLELCKRHLKDGGVMYYNATGSEDVAYTAAKVFRHVVRYKNFVAGSERPFALTAAEIRGNLMKFRFGEKATFASEEPAIRRIVEELCSSDLSDKAEELRRRRGLWKITDDNMATEYKRRAWYAPQRSWGAFFRQRRESHSGG